MDKRFECGVYDKIKPSEIQALCGLEQLKFTGNGCFDELDSMDVHSVLDLIEVRKNLVEDLDDAEMRFALDEASREAYVDEYGYQPDKSWYGDWGFLQKKVELTRAGLEIFDSKFPLVKLC